MNKRFLIGALAVTVIALAGCAGGSMQSPSSADYPKSGFLSDYSKLKAVDGQEGTFRYIEPGVNLRPYQKIMIDPVQLLLAKGADPSYTKPEVMQRLGDAIRTEFVGTLLNGYTIVKQPGPGVIRIRLAITQIQPVSPDLTATDFIPIKAVFNVARSAAGEAPQVAELTAEVEILDPTGRVVAQAVSTRKADKKLPQGEKITWADLKLIVDVWAKNMKNNLDYLRGFAGE